MDIKETGKKLKPFAPVLSVALVTACVAGSLSGYEAPVYAATQEETPAKKEETKEKKEEKKTAAKGTFDLEDGVYKGTGTGYAEYCPNAECVMTVDGYTTDMGMTAAENILTAHPEVVAILGINDSGALGAYETCVAQGVDTDKFYIGGNDGTQHQCICIQRSIIHICCIINTFSYATPAFVHGSRVVGTYFTTSLQQLVNQYQSRGFTHVICFGFKGQPPNGNGLSLQIIIEMLLQLFE